MKPALLEEIEMTLDMHYQTEIINRLPMEYEKGDNLMQLVARGSIQAEEAGHYPRPMFQVLPPLAPRPLPPRIKQLPCTACGDFSRTWNCEAHTHWSPIGDEDDLTAPSIDSAGAQPLGWAMPDSLVPRDASHLPPRRAFMMDVDSARPVGFGIHEQLAATLEEITRRTQPVVPRGQARMWLGDNEFVTSFTLDPGEAGFDETT